MKKIDFSQGMTILANLGVLGGLVFVGMQLQQDRAIALADRFQELETNYYYWAELVNADNKIWVRGLAGEELSPGEMVQFNSLAEARQFALFSRWLTSGSSVAAGTVNQDSFLQEAAIEIASNPGFLTWWRSVYQHKIDFEVEGAGNYDESLNAAINAFLESSEHD